MLHLQACERSLSTRDQRFCSMVTCHRPISFLQIRPPYPTAHASPMITTSIGGAFRSFAGLFAIAVRTHLAHSGGGRACVTRPHFIGSAASSRASSEYHLRTAYCLSMRMPRVSDMYSSMA